MIAHKPSYIQFVNYKWLMKSWKSIWVQSVYFGNNLFSLVFFVKKNLLKMCYSKNFEKVKK